MKLVRPNMSKLLIYIN